jgi:hypothetical protein
MGLTSVNVVCPLPPLPSFSCSLLCYLHHDPINDIFLLDAAHILRLLSTHHILREVKPDVFANNRISALMDSGKEVRELVGFGRLVFSSRLLHSFFPVLSDFCVSFSLCSRECFFDGETDLCFVLSRHFLETDVRRRNTKVRTA